MNLVAELKEFVALHRPRGGMMLTVGERTSNGYPLGLACAAEPCSEKVVDCVLTCHPACGVTFERGA